MVTRIQQARSSSIPVLQYNEDKVAKGLATPVFVRNTPFDRIPPEESPIASIFGLFEDLEGNPAKSKMVRTPSFHMTVNPSDEDVIDEKNVIDYINDVMTELGYGEQPYIVYRHNDIDREHWHIVSTKLRPDGSCVRSSFEGYNINKIQERLCAKYGITPGRGNKQEQEEHDDILDIDGRGYVEFSGKAMQKKKLLRSIVDISLQFNYRSVYEFRCILEAMCVGTKEVNKGDHKELVLYGLENGKRISKGFYMSDKVINRSYPDVEKKAEHNALGPIEDTEESRKIQIASEYVMKHSSSLTEYASKMRSLNLVVSSERNAIEGITRITIVSRRLRTVLDSNVGTIDISKIRRAEETGRWMAPHKGRRSASEIKAASAVLSPAQIEEVRKLVSGDTENKKKGVRQEANNINTKIHK